MQLKDAIRKTPVTVAPDTTLVRAARTLDENGVGALVVVDEDRPVGIVTDRDIAVRAVAKRYPPDARIDSVMSTDLVTLSPEAEVHEALEVFDTHPIRRLPLVDEDGGLAGMITTDDLLVNAASDLAELVKPITGQVLFGHPEAEVPAVR